MHEYTSTVRIWELTCPGLLEEVGRARRWTRDVLAGSPHADSAALIVSELGTNALLHSSSGHGAGAFHVNVARYPGAVVVSVLDSGGAGTAPHVEHPGKDNPHGRGLALVHALAQRVHVCGDHRRGHTVTAELRDPLGAVHPAPGAAGARTC
ncbi:ATP-binding protein [Streptomyces albus]|uniref:ATP-binding protein n=1 Tax=Streptomyces albus TaxID=1888 RepID=UPI003401706A